MKAIFMTEVDGRLMEIDRREIQPTNVYYCAVRDPIQIRALQEFDDLPTTLTPKRERWIAVSRPVNFNSEKDFAVFLLDCIE